VDPRAPEIRVLVSAKTDVGRHRQTNEDACSITELETGSVIDALDRDCTVNLGTKGVLLAVSDGMGGHQAGEVASALVLESLQRELTQNPDKPLHKHLEDAVHRANRRVHNAARSAERHGMGATLTAIFIRGSEAYIAEVGDSRGYLLRNGRFRQMTRDQSMVQLLVDQGVMSKEDARKAPGKNVILQAVGLNPDVRVAIGKLDLRRGDRLLICSDGVTNQVSDDELCQILTRSEPREACETIIALANERGGDDNETVIVADVLGEELPEVDEYETVTSTFEVLQAFEARPQGDKPRRRTRDQLKPPSGNATPVPLIKEEPLPAIVEKPAEPPGPPKPTASASAFDVGDAVEAIEDPEIEITSPVEVIEDPDKPAAAADAPAAGRSGSWISSLIGRLSRNDKPKR
jgi:PPM family protein phosphatase